jgi:hypothetical protein
LSSFEPQRERSPAARWVPLSLPADQTILDTFNNHAIQRKIVVVPACFDKLWRPFRLWVLLQGLVDVHDVVQASLKNQLRNLSQYTWISWDDAANYLLAEKIGLDSALNLYRQIHRK